MFLFLLFFSPSESVVLQVAMTTTTVTPAMMTPTARQTTPTTSEIAHALDHAHGQEHAPAHAPHRDRKTAPTTAPAPVAVVNVNTIASVMTTGSVTGGDEVNRLLLVG